MKTAELPRARRIEPRPAQRRAGAWPAAGVALVLGIAAAWWAPGLSLPLDLMGSVMAKTPAAPGAALIDAVSTGGLHGLWLAPAGFVATQWLMRGWRGAPWLFATLILVAVAILVSGSGVILARHLLASGSQGPPDAQKLMAIIAAFVILPAAYGWAAGALADGVVGVRFQLRHAFGAALAGIGTVWGCSWLAVIVAALPPDGALPATTIAAVALLAAGYAAHAALWRSR